MDATLTTPPYPLTTLPYAIDHHPTKAAPSLTTNPFTTTTTIPRPRTPPPCPTRLAALHRSMHRTRPLTMDLFTELDPFATAAHFQDAVSASGSTVMRREIMMQYFCKDLLSASTMKATTPHAREGSVMHTFHFSTTHEQDTERRAGYLTRMTWLGQGRNEVGVQYAAQWLEYVDYSFEAQRVEDQTRIQVLRGGEKRIDMCSP